MIAEDRTMVSKEQTFERRGGDPSPDATGDGNSSAELEALVRELRTDLRSIYGSLKRTVFVEWQRLRLRAVDTFFRAAFFLCLLGFALAATISASLYVVRGIRNGLFAWSGSEWIGDLAGGIVILAVSLGGCLLVRARLRNDIVRQTKRALVPKPPESKSPSREPKTSASKA
jgi:hypothetical protein